MPVASDDVVQEAAAVVDRVSAALSPEELVELNARSVQEQLAAGTITRDRLSEQDLAG